ncbi:MAG: PocR ligand-binding domain-containing protein [Desulfotalea sp.]
MSINPSYEQLEKEIVRLNSQLKPKEIGQNERLQFSIEANNDGIWDLDLVLGKAHYSDYFWNILGYEGMVDCCDVNYWHRYVHKGDLQNVIHKYQDCIDGKIDEFSIEFKMRNKHGEWLWILSKGKVVVRGSDCKAQRIIGTHRDINLRKNRELALENKLATLTTPKDDFDFSISELINIKELQNLQDQFAVATSTASIINDSEGKPVTQPSNFSKYCRLIRSTAKGEANCLKSDSLLLNEDFDGTTIKMCRKGGLQDASTSIYLGNKFFVNWMIGQARDPEDTLSENEIREYAVELEIDEDALVAAYLEIPIIDKEKFTATCNAQYQFAKQLSASAYQNLNQARIICQLERSEARASKANDILIGVLSTISDPIILTPYNKNYYLNFTEVNKAACERFGYTKSEFYELSASDIAMQDAIRIIQVSGVQRKLDELGEVTFETVCRTKGGEAFPAEVQSKIIVIEGVKTILSVIKDVSYKKKAQKANFQLERQLNQAQKLESIGRLAGGVAHDFNNMLGVIQGHAELGLDITEDTDPVYFDLQQIKKAAEHSSQLTKQLLTFARKQPIVLKMVDVNSAINSILKMLNRLIGSKNSIYWLQDTETLQIKIDPSQLTQILTNFCINAKDAMEDGGTITIETSSVVIEETVIHGQDICSPGSYAIISVRDEGTGIDKDALPFLFEPFYTTKGVGKGTGLGLSTVYGIVKQNSGFIETESEVGTGTCFKVYLPMKEQGKKLDLGQNSDQHDLPVLNDLKNIPTILVVDDRKEILSMTSHLLALKNYNVLSASAPGEAIEIAKAHVGSIDLLLVDVVMAEMDGIELRDKIANLIPNLKVLFMSGFTSNVIADQGMEKSEINFISKPFSRSILYHKISEILYGVGSMTGD